MATINHHIREINFKIVYYGAGVSGKTTCLQYLHRALRPETRGPLVMLPTTQDRTLYFDFLPLKLPKLRGYSTRVHLYTVPGQVHYNSTRQLVLSGADGLIFVVDSQPDRLEANLESLENLGENLAEQNRELDDLPWVIQYNKRDLPNAMTIGELAPTLDQPGVPAFETTATVGTGVLEALKTVVKGVLIAYREEAAIKEGAVDADLLGESMREEERHTTPSALPAVDGEVPPPSEDLPAGAPPPPEELHAEDLPPPPEELPLPADERPPADDGSRSSEATSDELQKAEPPSMAVSSFDGLTSAVSGLPSGPTTGPNNPVVPARPATGPATGPIAGPTTTAGPTSRSKTRIGKQMPAHGWPLRRLVRLPAASAALGVADHQAARGNWVGVVRAVEDACVRLAPTSEAGAGPALMLGAFLTGVPPARLVRLEKLIRRVEEQLPVTEEDALFAVFYLCDLALRVQERQAERAEG